MPHDRPRRLTPPPPYGSMLKGVSRSAPEMRIPLAKGETQDYLALVRRLPCLKCGMEGCDAAHLKFSSAKHGKMNSFGKRVRLDDAVPLCRSCHTDAKDAQHKGSEQAFWDNLTLDPYQIASQLYAQRGDFTAMHAVIMVAISQRKKR